MYEGILEFQGTWRKCQSRVLKHYDDYKKDQRIHIVAAPGSGKTTLGIELIRRINEPVVIFAPTITIREQWEQRIKEAFLCVGIRAEDYISQDLRYLKLINITTYQSLHSAMTKYQGELVEEEDEGLERKELVDYHDYDFIQAIRVAKIQTMCLDECHHLRSEWWKSLELFKKEAQLTYTIALTATPPYDSSPQMWQRYMDMCGEIDEEMTVPELVKEGSLCPHQDYVYFNYPTSKEEKEIKQFKDKSEAMLQMFMNDSSLLQVIQSHSCLHGQIDYDKLLEKPEYLSSILIFLNAHGLRYPSEFQRILGFKQLEEMSTKWLEILLQGLLYDDTDSYDMSDEYKDYLLKELKSRGFVEKRQVTLVASSAIEKMLVKSVGKCDSLKDIVFHEYECMNDDLRLLILTDYKRSEYEKTIGNEDMDVHNIGVLPFFELLRRENQRLSKNLKFAVLCGTMVIIPASARQRLLELTPMRERISFTKVGNLSEDEYVEVKVQGDQHFLVGLVSELFEMGYMQVLIGTKSLLGEGWDSPCVNTLILASFVGSFMLSNQMRGRAIRTYRKNPEKTSHIWHLVCVDPSTAKEPGGLFESEDYQTLKRRSEHFLGLHYEDNTIENGIARMNAIKYPLSKHNIALTNKAMLRLSKDRSTLKRRWDDALTIYDQIEIVDENEVNEHLITTVVLNDAIRRMIITIICAILALIIGLFLLPIQGIGLSIYFGVYAFVFLLAFTTYSRKIIMFKNPLNRLKVFGDGILKALHCTNQLESMNCVVKTELVEAFHMIYLAGGTSHDKNIFAKCVNEFFDAIDNQRYILYSHSKRKSKDGYFVVPAAFARRKEDAMLFAEYLKPFIGNYEVVYTRNEQGRKILLQGRIHALANKQERVIHKKKVKGALE